MRADFLALHEKFNDFSDCLLEVLDRIEKIEDRVTKLEAFRSAPEVHSFGSYAAATATPDSTR